MNTVLRLLGCLWHKNVELDARYHRKDEEIPIEYHSDGLLRYRNPYVGRTSRKRQQSCITIKIEI
jgi:hypothetical protein